MIHRKDTACFTEQQLNMCYNQAVFTEFLSQPFSLEAFEKQMQWKKDQFPMENRRVLVKVLKEQYQTIDNIHPKVQENIDSLLNENTFTVVTGHQLVALTGPLYFIYKIAHVIRSTEELKKQYPTNHFVPVFWMATEDHDYEEIKSLHLFNKTFIWETNQTGPVGKFDLNGWDDLIHEFSDLFKNNPDSEVFTLLKKFNGATYGEAFFQLVHQLFNEYGLVILDADQRELKQLFVPYMQKELKEHFSEKAILKTTDKLIQKGGKQQITPRNINLFFMQNGIRERLDLAPDGSIEIASKGKFTLEEINQMLLENPAYFSPNVSLRPLYQEVILPNLCYVGGSGEINYWLQLKEVFDVAAIIFPLLQTRNSVLWIDALISEKITKLNLKPIDLFKETSVLTKAYLEENAADEVDFSTLDEQLANLKKTLIATTLSIDPNMENFAQAEGVRLEKQLEQIKDRLYKTVKGKHDKNLKTIVQIKERLFPSNSMQERYTNLFQLAPTGNYKSVIQTIVDSMQPFSPDFIILEEEASM